MANQRGDASSRPRSDRGGGGSARFAGPPGTNQGARGTSGGRDPCRWPNARRTSVAPSKAARLEYWHRRYLERLRREDPQGYEAALREEAGLDAAGRDEVRMARPILAALDDESIARGARERVQAIAMRPRAEADPPRVPPSPDVVWTDDDRLTWEEFIGGVPCDAGAPSSAMRGASAMASPGRRTETAWSRSRQRSGRGIPITARAGRSAVGHPIAGTAARHIPCPLSRSSASTRS